MKVRISQNGEQVKIESKILPGFFSGLLSTQQEHLIFTPQKLSHHKPDNDVKLESCTR